MTDQILTEEELNNIHDDIYGSLDYSERAMLAKLIESHMTLLSTNAELSFKNQKLKEAMVMVVENMELIEKNHEAALEELKHE